jgi:hypothetical protein
MSGYARPRMTGGPCWALARLNTHTVRVRAFKHAT